MIIVINSQNWWTTNPEVENKRTPSLEAAPMASSSNPSPSTLHTTEDGEENSGDEDENDEMLDPRVKVNL